MNNSILLSFELDGKEYVLVNNRDVVRKAATIAPDAFDSLLEEAQKEQKKSKQVQKKQSFLQALDDNEKNMAVLKPLFACSLMLGTPDVEYDEAVDIYELLIYNLEAEQLRTITERLMALLNNTDFIKGSNQRKATIKMKF